MVVLNNFIKTKIIDNKLIASNTYLISFERFFNFNPGQWVALKIRSDDSPRLYSIASGTKSKIIEILYDVKPNGLLTNKMSKLVKGDIIFVSEPSGKFLREIGEGWFIATGTGIAPFRSMILSGMGEGKKLLFGARTLNSFYFEQEFEYYLGENFIKCCSGEVSANIFSGRVTDYLKNYSNLNVNEKYYLCGKSEMIVDVRDLLLEKKVPFRNIIAEIYF